MNNRKKITLFEENNKPKERKESTSLHQMTNTMKNFSSGATRATFNGCIDATNAVLKKFGKNPRDYGDDQVGVPGLVVAAVPTLAVGIASAAVSVVPASFIQIKRSTKRLNSKKIEWLKTYGIALLQNCEPTQINEILNHIQTQHKSTKLSNYTSENLIDFILDDLNNNGRVSYKALYKTLRFFHPQSSLESIMPNNLSNVVLEYLFVDFNVYREETLKSDADNDGLQISKKM